MEFLKLLLTGGLILIGARIVLNDENSENNSDLIIKDRLPDYIKPKHYNIQLTIKPNIDVVISGICNINISVELPTYNISLHAHRQYIQILETYLHLESNPRFHLKLQNYTYNNESHILTFHSNYEIQLDRYILKITFTSFGTNNGEGFFTTSYANVKGNKELAEFLSGWTNFYPIGARRVFPCWDEPAIKATFTISIKHHNKYSPLFNMPKIQPIPLGNNMSLKTFGTTPSISTYQIAIAMLDSAVIPGVIWSRNSTLPVKLANGIFHKIMRLGIEQGFHNYTDVENIAIPGFQYDSTGYWRLTFYRETAIIYDDKIDSVGHKINMARLMAREAVRHWFSKISPSWWSLSWLNEGIVRLLGLDAIDKIFPDYGRLSIVQIKQESLRLDIQSIMKPLISQINSPSEINSLFSFSYYMKGPVILQMLQYLLTDEVFQRGLHNYLNRHKYDSASVDDFWTAMQDALDKSQPSVFSLKEIFHAWTYRPHYPVLNVIHYQDIPYFRRIMYIWQENINGSNWSQWWLPMTNTTQEYSFFNNISLVTATWPSTVPKREITVRVATKDDWIIANKQQIGYYRVYYDTTNWLRIAETLNSKNYTKIHVLNRAQIIDDAYHFVMTGKLDVFIFLELARYLKQETDFVAWYPMIKAFEDMSSYFPFQESAYIKENMRTILDGLLEKIGYEEITNNDISNSLRQEAAKWACIMGSYGCMKVANLKLRFLFEHKNTSLPYWKHWTYCNGFMDSSTWSKMYNNYREEYGSTILKFVACSDNAIIMYLMVPENYNELQDIDRINIFHSFVARHAKNNLMLHYILVNFEKIKPKKVSTTALLINIINYVYSKEQLETIIAFMEDLPETIIDKFLNEDIQRNINKENGNMEKQYGKLISFVISKIEIRLSQMNSQINRFADLTDLQK